MRGHGNGWPRRDGRTMVRICLKLTHCTMFRICLKWMHCTMVQICLKLTHRTMVRICLKWTHVALVRTWLLSHSRTSLRGQRSGVERSEEERNRARRCGAEWSGASERVIFFPPMHRFRTLSNHGGTERPKAEKFRIQQVEYILVSPLS